ALSAVQRLAQSHWARACSTLAASAKRRAGRCPDERRLAGEQEVGQGHLDLPGAPAGRSLARGGSDGWPRGLAAQGPAQGENDGVGVVVQPASGNLAVPAPLQVAGHPLGLTLGQLAQQIRPQLLLADARLPDHESLPTPAPASGSSAPILPECGA